MIRHLTSQQRREPWFYEVREAKSLHVPMYFTGKEKRKKLSGITRRDWQHKSQDRVRPWRISSQASWFMVPQKWGEIITLSICTGAMRDAAARPLLLESIKSHFTCLHPSKNTEARMLLERNLFRVTKRENKCLRPLRNLRNAMNTCGSKPQFHTICIIFELRRHYTLS